MSDLNDKGSMQKHDTGEPDAGAQGQSQKSDMDRYLTYQASAFRYPPTPDISSAVRNKLAGDAYKDNPRTARKQPALKPRRAWVTMAVTAAMLIASLLTVPSVRAFVTDVYVGVVHIVQGTPEPEKNMPTITPVVPWNPMLTGEIDLGSAYKFASIVKLPAYPADLGLPDHVYYQSGSQLLLFVWMDKEDPSRPKLALYQIPPNMTVTKSVPEGVVTENVYVGQGVKKTHGYWIQGQTSVALQYYDENENRTTEVRELVPGYTIVWSDEATGFGYKLVGDFSKEEAIKIIGSLAELSPRPEPLPTATPASPAANLDLAGETYLFKLEDLAGFRIKIPVLSAKPELIQPDRVYYQTSTSHPERDRAVIMVWLVPDRPDDVRMVLTQGMRDSTSGVDVTRGAIRVSVNGMPATWVQAPQSVYIVDRSGKQMLADRTYVSGSYSLIWQEGNIYYRLETTLNVEEAIRIAESLK